MVTDKIKKALGNSTVEEMDKLGEYELRKVIVEANQAMKEVKEQLEANPKYQGLKSSLHDCTQGKRDVNKRQNAKIQYALHRMTEIGAPGTSSTLDEALQNIKDLGATLEVKWASSPHAEMLKAKS